MMLQQQLLLSFMYLSVRCWESSTITIEYYNASNDIPYSEILALSDFYQSTAGDHWEWRDDAVYGARWNFTLPAPCTDSWQGIDCEWGLDGSYHVVNLTLSSYNLSGTLPDTISDLTQLVFLYLYSNQLTGSIPTAIGQLTHLEVLSFDLNQLTHSIPDSIVNLTNLTHIFSCGITASREPSHLLRSRKNIYLKAVSSNLYSNRSTSQVTYNPRQSRTLFETFE